MPCRMRTSPLPIQTGSPALTWMVPKLPKTAGKSWIWQQPTSFRYFATTFPFPGLAGLNVRARSSRGWLTFESGAGKAEELGNHRGPTRCDGRIERIEPHKGTRAMAEPAGLV